MTNCFPVKTTRRSLAHRYFFLCSAVLWTLLIAVLCLVSFNQLPSLGVSGADKYVHGTFHFGFMVLWFLSFAKNDFDKTIFRVFLASFLYGILIEIAQELFTTTRHADLYDVAANLTGAFMGVSVIMIGRFYLNRK